MCVCVCVCVRAHVYVEGGSRACMYSFFLKSSLGGSPLLWFNLAIQSKFEKEIH